MADDGNIQLPMLALLILWVALVVVIVRYTIARGSVGLPAAMAFTMTFLYGGCFVYVVRGYSHVRAGGDAYLRHFNFTEATVLQGTFASVLGLLGLAVGCMVFWRSTPTRATQSFAVKPMGRRKERILLIVLGSIALASFALHLSGIAFPMSAAIIEAGRNVAMAFIALGSFLAMRRGKSLIAWYAAGALVPAYFLFGFGFLAAGFLFFMVFASFWLAQLRKPGAQWGPSTFVVAPGIFMGAMSLFITWMSVRDAVRQTLWYGGNASVLENLFSAISKVEVFSIWNFEALDVLNTRLNLPLFIGKMIEHHQLYPELRQYGATLATLPLVFLPRDLWPDKPSRGGTDFMSQHTGIEFSESVTFGTGPVFEFYVNFGYIGIFVGFIIFGMLLQRLDQAAAAHLSAGRFLRFARLFVVGVVAIDPLMRPFFIVNGALIAWILMTALILLVEPRPKRVRWANLPVK